MVVMVTMMMVMRLRKGGCRARKDQGEQEKLLHEKSVATLEAVAVWKLSFARIDVP